MKGYFLSPFLTFGGVFLSIDVLHFCLICVVNDQEDLEKPTIILKQEGLDSDQI